MMSFDEIYILIINEMKLHIKEFAVGFILLIVFDLFINRTTVGIIARWKCIHAFANLLISFFCINDLLKTAVDPIGATKGVRGVDYSMKPAYMILCLHIYHLLPFMRFKLHDGDVFHHLVFVGIVGPVGIAFDTGPLQNFVAFFICGLPGALDYIMLVLVKLKMLSRYDEKVWNARINVWLRSPGLTIASCFIYLGILYGDDDSRCKKMPILSFLTAALILINGQYYSQVVVGNTFRTVQRYNS